MLGEGFQITPVTMPFHRADGSIGIYIDKIGSTAESCYRCDNVVMVPYKGDDAYRPERPNLVLSNTSAQRLMDLLWNCGLRPTEGKGSAGAFNAQGKHLEDMRKIAFAQLQLNEKGTNNDQSS